jgi:hypothetical protein
VKIGIHNWKGCVAMCEVSSDGCVQEPRLVSRSYGFV